MININHLKHLQTQHQDLENTIHQYQTNHQDDLTIKNLKKQKLLIKEKIDRILNQETELA